MGYQGSNRVYQVQERGIEMKYEKPIMELIVLYEIDLVCTSPQDTIYEGDGPYLF